MDKFFILILAALVIVSMYQNADGQFLHSSDDEEIVGYDDNIFMERGGKGGKKDKKMKEVETIEYDEDEDEEVDCKKMKKKEKLIAFQKVVKVPRVTIVEKKKKKKKKHHYY